jgi:hypothetical protein
MVETVAYEELGQIGEVELRHYPEMSMATVSANGGNEAFSILFRYISGDNRPREKIAMTAPVITAEKIAMTTPVVSDATSMSFVMPKKYAKEDLPEPLDARVHIQRIPPRTVAVIRFKGYADERSVAEETSRLLSTLEANRIRTVGRPFLMRYNAPLTPGFMRRNEVGIEIERNEG